jgi:hypothetical protein
MYAHNNSQPDAAPLMDHIMLMVDDGREMGIRTKIPKIQISTGDKHCTLKYYAYVTVVKVTVTVMPISILIYFNAQKAQ